MASDLLPPPNLLMGYQIRREHNYLLQRIEKLEHSLTQHEEQQKSVNANIQHNVDRLARYITINSTKQDTQADLILTQFVEVQEEVLKLKDEMSTSQAQKVVSRGEVAGFLAAVEELNQQMQTVQGSIEQHEGRMSQLQREYEKLGKIAVHQGYVEAWKVFTNNGSIPLLPPFRSPSDIKGLGVMSGSQEQASTDRAAQPGLDALPQEISTQGIQHETQFEEIAGKHPGPRLVTEHDRRPQQTGPAENQAVSHVPAKRKRSRSPAATARKKPKKSRSETKTKIPGNGFQHPRAESKVKHKTAAVRKILHENIQPRPPTRKTARRGLADAGNLAKPLDDPDALLRKSHKIKNQQRADYITTREAAFPTI